LNFSDMRIGEKLFADFAIVLLLTAALEIVAVVQRGAMDTDGSDGESVRAEKTAINEV